MGQKPLNAAQTRQGRLHGKAQPGKPAPAAWAQGNGSGTDAAAAAGLRSPPADVTLDDWQDLFNAVKARLRQTVGEPAGPRPMGPAAFLQIQAGVLECAAALDQLHDTLVRELGRCRQLDREMRTTQDALAQARAEPAGTRAEDQ